MASIGSFLFGESPSAQSLPTMSPEQQAALVRLLQELGSGETFGGATPYEGQITAGLGDLENLSLEALEQKILQQVSGTGAGSEAETALLKMLKTGGAPVDFEDYFAKAIRDPTIKDFSELVLPEITRRFGSSGAFGSDRMTAESMATDRLMKTLIGARSDLSYRTQSDALNRIMQAIGLAPGVQGGNIENILKMISGAGLPRQVEQAKLTGEYTEFQRQQQQQLQRINQILAALGLKTVDNVSVGGTPSFLSAFFSGAGKNLVPDVNAPDPFFG